MWKKKTVIYVCVRPFEAHTTYKCIETAVWGVTKQQSR